MTTLGARVDEVLRIGSARATERIVRRWGTELGMWVGAGYPKSGTVWLCKLMASYLGVPYPQNYRLPIAMSSVIHAHWQPSPDLPPAAYIHRDGRDVMVSLYFHHMRNLAEQRNPVSARRLHERLSDRLGPGFDPDDARANLPAFIESEFTAPAYAFGNWADHVVAWKGAGLPHVAFVSYEDLLREPEVTLSTTLSSLTGEEADPLKVRLACDRQNFRVQSGRQPGAEDRSSFLRSGIAGDWQNYFSRLAGETFDKHAGAALYAFGYADPGWFESLDG